MAKVYGGAPISETEENEILRTATLFATTKAGRAEIDGDIKNYGGRGWIRSDILEQALIAGKRQREITKDIETQLKLAGKDARTAQAVIRSAMHAKNEKAKGRAYALKICNQLSNKGKNGWEIYKATEATIRAERASDIEALRDGVDHFYDPDRTPGKTDREDEQALKVIGRLGLRIDTVLGVSHGIWTRPTDEHLEKLWEDSPLSLHFHAVMDAASEIYLDSTHVANAEDTHDTDEA
jgi:hypothetical protein